MLESPVVWSNPSTWSWVVYAWLAIALIGAIRPAWRWFQRGRGVSWPLADGRIDSARISKPTFSLSTRQGRYLAEILYSYTISGSGYSGRFTRDLPTEYEAEDFTRDLQSKAIVVHYNPEKPSRSVLLASDLDLLLKGRSPAPPPKISQSVAIPKLVRTALPLLIAFSGIGLVVSLWVHLGAIMGRQVAPEPFFWMLHVGIFIVWLPAVLIAQRLVGNMNRSDLWKAVLKGSPPWMRYTLYTFFGYAVINFLLFMANAPSHDSGASTPPAVWRGFSGHWMAFYSAALAILYSAFRNEASAQQKQQTDHDAHS